AVGKALADELEDRLWPVEAGHARLAELADAQVCRQIVLDEHRRRAREEDLAAVAEVADPGRLVHGEADVALAVHGGLARVNPHAHPDGAVLGPGVRGEGPLGRGGGGDGRAGASEDEEEGVALAVDLDALLARERVAQEGVVPAEERAVAVAPQVLQQPGRALDIREEKGDRPCREVASCRHLALPTPPCAASTYLPAMVLAPSGIRKGAGESLGVGLGSSPIAAFGVGGEGAERNPTERQPAHVRTRIPPRRRLRRGSGGVRAGRLGERARPPLRRGRERRRGSPRRLARRRGRPDDGDHGPLRLGQVDAHASPRRTRHADRGDDLARRHGDHASLREEADAPAARHDRLRLPVLQPPADADGRGERDAAPLDRRPQGRRGVARHAARRRRHRGTPSSPPLRALGRPAAAGRRCARARDEAEGDLRRRADRQPRLELVEGRALPASPLGGRVGADDRDGHPRRGRSRTRRPDPLHRRRSHRSRPRGVHRGGGSRRDAGSELEMSRVALRGLLGRRVRAVLTALAIVLGVAMVSGSFVLTDTISRAFDSIFSSSYGKTDAVVSGKKLVDYSSSGNATVSPALLRQIRAQRDVAAAAGAVLDFGGDSTRAKIIGRDGKAIDHNGAGTFGIGVDTSQPRFNPLQLTAGRWAAAPDEVVIDPESAKEQHFALGDRIGIAANGPVRQFRLVGIAKYGGVESLGGATFAVFTIPEAQKLLHLDGYTAISVAAKDGLSSTKLVGDLQKVVPGTAQVRTAAAQAKQDEKDISTVISFIRGFLLAFGGIALFVGAFVIFNTLSITVAQRTRELATLRTLGATRRQVLRSVVLESAALGVLASVVGLFSGFGLAKGLSSLFGALGLGLPEAAPVYAARTFVVSLLLGILVTVVAGVIPAVRATKVAPIAAAKGGLAPK